MTTRKLIEADREDYLALVSQEPVLNLYFLGNAAALCFDDPIWEVWGDFVGGTLVGVLMRYTAGWNVYDTPGTDLEAFARIIDNHPIIARRLQDNVQTAPSLLPLLRNYVPTRVEEQTLCRLRAEDFRDDAPPWPVRRATWRDLEVLAQFYARAEEMTRSRPGVERPLRDGRVFVVEEGGEIVSAALTNAEIPGMAMIGGVYTPPRHRGRGYARACVAALCRELLAEGKTPVLYYGNPAAGHVYRRLGFIPIGTWRSVRLARKRSGGEEGVPFLGQPVQHGFRFGLVGARQASHLTPGIFQHLLDLR